MSNLSSVINELFFDKWELLANESSETIFANPRLVTGIGSAYPVLNYNDKVVLSRLARDGGTVDSAVASCNADISSGNLQAPAIGYGAFGGAAVAGIFQKPGSLSSHDAYGGTAPGQLALEVLKGQTEYEKPGMVLRHTSYCSAGSTYNASTAHAMQIYTPAQLLTEVGSGWTYNLPPRIYSKIAGIAFEYAALHEQPYYTWGWLKKITREPVLANFMVEVSTEYVLGLWSNLRYATR